MNIFRKIKLKYFNNQSTYQDRINQYIQEPRKPRIPPKEDLKIFSKKILVITFELLHELGYNVDSGYVDGSQGRNEGFVVHNVPMMSHGKIPNLIKIIKKSIELIKAIATLLYISGIPDKPFIDVMDEEEIKEIVKVLSK